MQRLLRTLTLFQVLLGVEMNSQSGNVTGTEGGSVEIYCTYSDGYQYVSKYFCRYPCGYSDVLIKTEKTHKVFSKGRYSILNIVSTRRFSVTIKNLRLGDSGVYYCGVERWGPDNLTKVEVYVRNVTSVNTAPPSTLQTIKSTDQSSVSPTEITPALPLYGGVLGLLLCCVLVALAVLCIRPPNTQSTLLRPPAPENLNSDPPSDQGDISHVYDEMLTVYSVAASTNPENSSEAYSIIQCAPPAEEDFSVYSLISPY